MILYQDANSIIKLYIRGEFGSAETLAAVERADAVATSLISFAEVRAAMAAARRGRRIRSNRDYDRAKIDFAHDWPAFVRIGLTNDLVTQAGELAERHQLRGYDSVHLASAVALRERVSDLLEFATFDGRLSAAARREGFTVSQ